MQRQLWVDGNFAGTGGPPATNTNRPPVADLAYTYDKASNRLTANNENIAQSGWNNRDFAYTYDGLDRLTQADRGKAGGSFTHVANPTNEAFTPGQAWGLDTLGNWNDLVTDKDADGADGDGTDNTEAHTHNQANELITQDLTSAGPPDNDLTYDKAGNMRTQEVSRENAPTVITYTHDLWNRLVKVEYTPNAGSIATRAEYAYNALNWRIMKRSDTNPSVSTALDQERKMFYSAEWQLLEERIDDDYLNSAGVNRRFQYMWGPRYIDDIALRRLDGNADGDFGDSGTDFTYYHITDAQFSTIAVLNDAGVLQERVSYDAYGRARHHKSGDCFDGDGGVDTGDQTFLSATWGPAPGGGDVNRDGQVNINDVFIVNAQFGAGVPSGQLSTTDNVIGWDGYVFNPEIDGDGMYTVRRRHYRSGRWLERDPIGYIVSLNLYEYTLGSPVDMLDPYGLQHTLPGIRTVRPRPSIQLPPRRIPTRLTSPWRGLRQGDPFWDSPFEDPFKGLPPLPPGHIQIPQLTAPGVWAPQLIVPIPSAPHADQPIPTAVPIPMPGTKPYDLLPRRGRQPASRDPRCLALEAEFAKWNCHGYNSEKIGCGDLKDMLPDITNEDWCRAVESRRDRAKKCCDLRRQRWEGNCHALDQTHADEIAKLCDGVLPACELVAKTCRDRCGGIGPVIAPPTFIPRH